MAKPVIDVVTFNVNQKCRLVNEIITKQNGKFFTVDVNTKYSGRSISMNVRTGVKKFLCGGKIGPYLSSDVKTVFNVQKMDYRKVNMPGVQEIRANGVIYRFTDVREYAKEVRG